MKMNRKIYRIGDLSKTLNVKKFVIRFWEKELNLKPKRSRGGQRFYDTTDFETFSKIKTLLYDKKFTLKGAKLALHNEDKAPIKPNKKSSFMHVSHISEDFKISDTMTEQLVSLKKQLLQLKKQL